MHAATTHCFQLYFTVFFVNISIFLLKLYLSPDETESFSVASLQRFIEVNDIKEISLKIP